MDFEYQLKLEWKIEERVLSIIYVNILKQRIAVVNFEKNPILLPFGNKENPDWSDFKKFLRSRCFPNNRHNLNKLLKSYGLYGCDDLTQVEYFQGRTAEDIMYLNFIWQGGTSVEHL